MVRPRLSPARHFAGNWPNIALARHPAREHTSGMATAALIPVSEYLATTDRPDCDYVDGEVIERTMGEKPHSFLQGWLFSIFFAKRREWRLLPLTEQRVQVAATRFRIPDVCLISPDDRDERIVRIPPVLCIELFSSDDTLSAIARRSEDYLSMGVPQVWMIDPWKRTAFDLNREGIKEVQQALTIPGTAVTVELSTLFAELDDLLAGRL
jgi:Uma2 family endonuclease